MGGLQQLFLPPQGGFFVRAHARVFKVFKIFNYLEGQPSQCLCGLKSLIGTFITVIGDIYYGYVGHLLRYGA
jgi:hypothetical protein